MIFSAFKGMKPFPQLMFSAFIILVSFLSFMLLSMIVAIPVFGTDTLFNMSAISNLNNSENVKLLKYFQIVQSIGLFVVPPFILAWLFSGNVFQYLSLNKKVSMRSVAMVAVLIVGSLPFVNFIGEWNRQMSLPGWLSNVEEWMRNAEESAAALTEVFLKVDNLGGMLFNLFMIAFIPAIGEELLFRGIIQRIFIRWTKNQHWGIWISAILFSALHIQFYGFVPRLLLGVLFGYLLVWSGSIWLPICAHFFNNGFAVVGIYFIDKKILKPEIENIGAENELIVVFSMTLIILLMWILKRENRINFSREIYPD